MSDPNEPVKQNAAPQTQAQVTQSEPSPPAKAGENAPLIKQSANVVVVDAQATPTLPSSSTRTSALVPTPAAEPNPTQPVPPPKRKKQVSQRRLERTEAKLEELERRLQQREDQFKSHIEAVSKMMSWTAGLIVFFGLMLSGFGLMVSGMSIWGKVEVGNAVHDMERRFETLSGGAHKRPVLQILYRGRPIDGKSMDVDLAPSGDFTLPEIQLFNTGQGQAQAVNIRMYFVDDVEYVDGNWQKTFIPEGQHSAFFVMSLPISPQEVWNGETFVGKVHQVSSRTLKCVVRAFYGQETPAEATFDIHLVLKPSP